ncbi:MAG: hypothetical protein HY268_09500 [Deltaproteobacteria bacterium]|nr:hypothetical protein [Deltaproteobacteria bacterium]
MNDVVRWSITVSKDTDDVLRSYLAQQRQNKGELSKFVEEAVRWRVLDMTVRAIRERNKDIPEDKIQAVVDEAVATVRAKRRPTPKR